MSDSNYARYVNRRFASENERSRFKSVQNIIPEFSSEEDSSVEIEEAKINDQCESFHNSYGSVNDLNNFSISNNINPDNDSKNSEDEEEKKSERRQSPR